MVDRYPARVLGPLASYVAGFRAELVVLGYTPRVAQDSAYVLAHLSRWLESEGIAAAELTSQQVVRVGGGPPRGWLPVVGDGPVAAAAAGIPAGDRRDPAGGAPGDRVPGRACAAGLPPLSASRAMAGRADGTPARGRRPQVPQSAGQGGRAAAGSAGACCRHRFHRG